MPSVSPLFSALQAPILQVPVLQVPILQVLSVPRAPILQVQPVPGGPLAFLGTFLVSWALFVYAAQVAAGFFLGDVPWRRAVLVGLVPAVVNVLLVRQAVWLILLVGVVADFGAIRVVYGIRYRTTALVTVLHVAVSILFGVVLAYLLTLLSTAPV